MLRILLWLLVLSLCFLAGILISAPNLHTVTLSYYLGSSELPLALLLFVALATGALLGIVLNVVWVLRLRYENLRLHQHTHQLEREIATLRQDRR
jgi:uncharacterized integral membrane protein